jgi:hypothetical protein
MPIKEMGGPSRVYMVSAETGYREKGRSLSAQHGKPPGSAP